MIWLIAGVCVCVACVVGLLVGTTGGVAWPSGFALSIRLDRVTTAALVGASLAAAGVGYQATLRNPLAEPYLLGVSGGAALAAFAWTLPQLAWPAAFAAVGREVAAFAGGLLAVMIVLVLAGGRGRLDPGRAVLVGVVVSVLCGGVFALLVQLVREPTGGAMSFLFGRIGATTLAQRLWLGVSCVFTCGVLAFIGGRLSGMGQSDDEALALGLGVNKLRWTTIAISSLAAAVATGVAGPIGFVGLMGPHLARSIVGVDPRRVLPAAVACGAALLVLSDATGRFAVQIAGSEVPAGVVTNLIGGPFFLVLLYARRGRTAA